MACGLPIIKTAQPWLVLEGQNGIVLESNEPSLIRNTVINLIRNGDLKQKGEISRKIANRYDWSYIAKAAIGKYEGLLKNK